MIDGSQMPRHHLVTWSETSLVMLNRARQLLLYSYRCRRRVSRALRRGSRLKYHFDKLA